MALTFIPNVMETRLKENRDIQRRRRQCWLGPAAATGTLEISPWFSWALFLCLVKVSGRAGYSLGGVSTGYCKSHNRFPEGNSRCLAGIALAWG